MSDPQTKYFHENVKNRLFKNGHFWGVMSKIKFLGGDVENYWRYGYGLYYGRAAEPLPPKGDFSIRLI